MTHPVFRDQDALAGICRRIPYPPPVVVRIDAERIQPSRQRRGLLVEFQPDAKPSLLTMAGIEIELPSLLGGRKVDLRTAQDLSRYFREGVIRAAETQYEAESHPVVG